MIFDSYSTTFMKFKSYHLAKFSESVMIWNIWICDTVIIIKYCKNTLEKIIELMIVKRSSGENEGRLYSYHSSFNASDGTRGR